MLVRTDLALADQMVQMGHACLEAGRLFAAGEAPGNLALLQVGSQAQLLDAVARLEMAGICCAVFCEPDDGIGYSAACTEPVRSRARRVLRRYPLWEAPMK